MNDDAKMEKIDAWLLDLYEGDDAAPAPSNPAWSREAERLREMKRRLDDRPRKHPDAATLSAVFAAASGEAVPTPLTDAARRDRAPVRRRHATGLRVGAVSAVLVLLLGLAWIFRANLLPFGAAPETSTVAERSAAAAETDRSASAGEDAPGSASEPARSAASDEPRGAASGADSHAVPGASPYVPSPDPADGLPGAALADVGSETQPADPGRDGGLPTDDLAWDEQTDVIELHQRIELVGGDVRRTWDAPAIPLEMMPPGRGDRGIVPAGQSR